MPLSQSLAGKYYALVKGRGKRIKRSIGTDKSATERRKVKEPKREKVRIDVFGAGWVFVARDFPARS